ncbi:hypothetical protein G9A89_006530 [Geosiphon pyriformis]|nr:hypothetical protein G9A89_006530 [Geosiphon pyriformis]
MSNNKEDKMTAYIAKIPEFNREDIKTSPQEWLDQVTKAGDANKWNAARMLRTIPYFLKETAGEWFENLTTPFNDWTAFKTAFLEQFTNNNTSITLQNRFRNIKQEPSKSKVENYFANQQQQLQKYQTPQRQNQNNSAPLSNNQSQNCHYYGISGHWKRDCRKSNQHYPPPQQFYYPPPVPAYYLPKPQYQTIPTTTHTTLPINNNRISSNNQLVSQNSTQPRPNHYYTQPSYLTIPEEQNFHHIAFLEARIAKNANLSDIFPFEFEANKSPFLLSNVAANKQKAITVMYTEAEVEGKSIRLILDNGSARSIITYQLMQQLKRNVDQPAQTIIVTADGMKKTPVGEIDNFPFTIDGITIPVKVLIMDAPQYQALIRNNWLQKANANLNWETQELTISYQRQHV